MDWFQTVGHTGEPETWAPFAGSTSLFQGGLLKQLDNALHQDCHGAQEHYIGNNYKKDVKGSNIAKHAAQKQTTEKQRSNDPKIYAASQMRNWHRY